MKELKILMENLKEYCILQNIRCKLNAEFMIKDEYENYDWKW